MFSWLGKIFGSDKAISKGLDLIDDIWDTDEEKVAARVNLLKAYEPFKLAQRYIAFAFTGVFLACFFLALGMNQFGFGDLEGLKQIMGEFKIGYIMLAIVGFYFGGGMFNSLKGK
jgi:hypothetical protein